MHNYKIN